MIDLWSIYTTNTRKNKFDINSVTSDMKKEFSVIEILEKLKWYHGESFTTDLLNDDFVMRLEKENKDRGNKTD